MKEYTAKNLDEILKIAALENNVKVDELFYQVIEENEGFLGFGVKVTAKVYSKKDISSFIEEYLQQYFDNIDMKVEITVSEKEGFYNVNLDAENNAIIIGKNGKTLLSLNTVLKAAISSHFKRRVGVLIDVNGYKEDKYHKVQMLAVKVARQVQKTKIDAVLDPMPADERKAIHNYLSTMKYVRTKSEGEGNQRRLKIVYDSSKDTI